MSNRFVSGGTIDANGEVSRDVPSETARAAEVKEPAKNAEWEAVQRELESERARREQEKRKAAMGEEKSLYDILQANKAAKQEAFEEKNKIRNQFRALDDDEVEFLDEVKARQRAEEEQVRRETEEGLRAFRERLKSDGGGGGEGQGVGEGEGEGGEGLEEWAVGRKRKRVKERELRVKKKLEDGAEEEKQVTIESAATTTGVKDEKKDGGPSGGAKKGLGLVDYGSDSDED